MHQLQRLAHESPAPGSAAWLDRKAEYVESLAYRQACDVIRIGQALLEVKAEVGHGRFVAWVEAKLPFGVHHARRHMNVARAFAEYQREQFALFDPSALYVLAQPTGVRPEVRAHAVQLAGEGTRITHKLAKELVDAHRDVAVTRAEERGYGALRKELDRVRVEDDAGRVSHIDPDAAAARAEKRDADLAAALGRLARAACERYETVTVTRLDDEDDGPLFSVTGLRGGRTRTGVDADLRLAFEDVLDEGRTKHCPACCKPGEELPVARFCRNLNYADGRNGRCRACEKARKAETRRKRREERVKSGEPAPPAGSLF